MSKLTLSLEQRRLLLVLGCPSLGISFAYTLVITYLPVFIERLSNASVTGLVIGFEGFFALFVPLIIGGWSDSVHRMKGHRMPFIWAGTVTICLALILMPVSRDYLSLLVVELTIFFVGYFTQYASYYAVFPDLIPKSLYGRSQGVQGGFRALGLLAALVGGGFLLHLWVPLAFLIATVLLIVVTFILYYGIRHTIKVPIQENKFLEFEWREQWKFIRNNREIQLWFIANSLWESATSVLKVFVVLFFTRGLDFSLPKTSSVLGLVGIAAVFAAPISGKLADQYGHKTVILVSIIVFALGLIPPVFTFTPLFIAGIVPIAFSAIVLMTLPYSLLMGFLPQEKHHGTGAALLALSQGFGALIGPITAGFAVEMLKDTNALYFAETHGYVAIFPITSLFLLLSIPFAMLLFKNQK